VSRVSFNQMPKRASENEAPKKKHKPEEKSLVLYDGKRKEPLGHWLTGYRYFGPYNTVGRGDDPAPVDWVDGRGMVHDIAYGKYENPRTQWVPADQILIKELEEALESKQDLAPWYRVLAWRIGKKVFEIKRDLFENGWIKMAKLKKLMVQSRKSFYMGIGARKDARRMTPLPNYLKEAMEGPQTVPVEDHKTKSSESKKLSNVLNVIKPRKNLNSNSMSLKARTRSKNGRRRVKRAKRNSAGPRKTRAMSRRSVKGRRRRSVQKRRLRAASVTTAKAIARRTLNEYIQPSRELSWTMSQSTSIVKQMTSTTFETDVKTTQCLDWQAVENAVGPTSVNQFLNFTSYQGCYNWISMNYPANAIKGSAPTDQERYHFVNICEKYEIMFHSNVPVHYEIFIATCAQNNSGNYGFVECLKADPSANYIGNVSPSGQNVASVANNKTVYGFIQNVGFDLIKGKNARNKFWNHRVVKKGTWAPNANGTNSIHYTYRQKNKYFCQLGQAYYNTGDMFHFIRYWTDIAPTVAEPDATGVAEAGRIIPDMTLHRQSSATYTPMITKTKDEFNFNQGLLTVATSAGVQPSLSTDTMIDEKAIEV